MKKILKKCIFLIITAMLLSCTSALAVTYTHEEDLFNNNYFDGWSSSDTALEVTELEGEKVLKLDFGENGGTVVKNVTPTDFAAYLEFDFYFSNYSSDMKIPTIKFSNGEEISVLIDGYGRVNGSSTNRLKKNTWYHVRYNIHIRDGRYTGSVNRKSVNAYSSFTSTADNTITSIEFSAAANTELYIDNFSLSNTKKLKCDFTKTDLTEGGFLFISSGKVAADPTNTANRCYVYSEKWDQILLPPLTGNEKSVIEFDVMYDDINAKKPFISIGDTYDEAGVGAITIHGTDGDGMWYYGSGGSLSNNGRWSSQKWYRNRIELDGAKKIWTHYMTTDTSSGEFVKIGSGDWTDSSEVVDLMTIAEGETTTYIDNLVAWRNTGLGTSEIDFESIKAYDSIFETATLVVASYDGDRLVDVKLVEMTNPCVQTFEEMGLDTGGAHIVKAFMLDDLKNIAPVSDVNSALPYEESIKRFTDKTENNILMFKGSREIYVSNVLTSINAPVYENDSSVMYPIELLCKEMGHDYSYTDSNNRATVVTTGGDNIIIPVGTNVYRFNSKSAKASAATEKVNGVVFVAEDIITKMGMSVLKTDEGLIAVSGDAETLINENDAADEITYFISLYRADKVAEDAIQLYVATDGDDSAAGTIDAPLKTFEGARDKVRQLKANGMTTDIVVNFRGGTYCVASTIELEDLDSGTNGNRVIYRSYENEKAEFIRGQTLSWRHFTSVRDDSVAARFDESVRDKIKEIDLKKYGITSYGMIFPRSYGATLYAPVELYVDSEPLTLARYPNEGFISCAGVVKSGSAFASTGGDGTLNNPAIISFTETEPLSWQDSDDIYLYGQWDFAWVTNEQKPIIDKTNKRMTLQYMSFGIEGRNRSRYYYKNVLEELDIPGEYYIDRDSGIMYVYPTENMKNAEIVVTKMIEGTEVDEWELALEVAKSFSQANANLKPTNAKYTIVNFDNASNITIDGLSFKYTPGNAVTIKDGYNLMIKNSEIACAGIKAVDIEGGYDHVIKNCNMHDLGGGGVEISAGDRNTLTSCNIKVLGCEILDYDLITGGYAGAVYISGVGVTVKNNRIAGAQHFAVGYYGNDNVIQYNDISDVLKISDDAGAVYSFGDCSYWNNNISYNYFHDTKRAFHFSNDGGEAALTHGLVAAIYADNYVSGNTCIGNLAENFGSYFMFVHGGRNNSMFNNIYVSTGDKNVPSRIIRAGGSSDSAPTYTLDLVPSSGEIWTKRYPDLAAALKNMSTFTKPQYNKANWNIAYGRNVSTFDVAQIDDTVQNIDNILYNSATNPDGLFVDVSNQDYRLKNTSDFEKTFGNINNAVDYAEMGLSADYPFADQSEEIKRMFIRSDKFNSGVASYSATEGETIQLEVIARSTSGYVLDLSDADITFTSNSSAVTVNDDGLVTVNSSGTAQITANVQRGNETKSIYVNINCG